MNKNKDLLLKYLCMALPYGVKVKIKYNKEHGSSDRLRICSEGGLTLNTDVLGLFIEDEIYLKSYLRPMSSMTDKERAYYFAINEEIIICINWLLENHFDFMGLIPKGLAIEVTKDGNPYKD